MTKQIVLKLLREHTEEFLSGEAISRQAGVSRAAVWKAVEQLRQEGYGIESVPNRGYRLPRVTARLRPEELSEQIRAGTVKAFKLLDCKDFFVLTTNVDHQFQRVGFDKKRIFYTQGDYGLWQCSKPCHQETYDNYETVQRMVAEQNNMRVPTELIPRCPKCGRPMTMNLRCDETFVQDEGWYRACGRYEDFLRRHQGGKTLYLVLGVGANTPGSIKYPFWRLTAENPEATYACLNQGEAYAPGEIRKRAICMDGDIGEVLLKIVNPIEKSVPNNI